MKTSLQIITLFSSCFFAVSAQETDTKSFSDPLLCRDSIVVINQFDPGRTWCFSFADNTDYQLYIDKIESEIVLPAEAAYIELRQNLNVYPQPVFWCRANLKYSITGADKSSGAASISCINAEAEFESCFFTEMTDSLFLRTTFLEKYKQLSTLLKQGRFSQKCKEEHDKKVQFLEEYNHKHKLSILFQNLCATSFYADMIGELIFTVRLNKEPSHTDSLRKVILGSKPRVINEDLLFSSDYRGFLQSYSSFLSKIEYRRDSVSFGEKYSFQKKNFSGKIRDYLLFKTVLLSVEQGGSDSLVLDFEDDCTNKSYISFIRNRRMTDSLRVSLLKDTLLTFDLKKTALTEVIKQNKGKLLYADFWASWCTPCREMMAKSRKLHEKYKDRVSFIYISIDKDVNAWKRASVQEQLAGGHTFWMPAEADFIKRHAVKSIPRYILFGRNGEIVNDHAPRPDSPDLVYLFDK